MLRPQDNAVRERKNLDGLWDFTLDPQGGGRVAGWFRGPLPNARAMAVPASFNELAADAVVRNFFGDIWYQTVVRVPRGWQDRRVALYFESATHRATVWVDDTEVGSHEGGYTPFEFDITDHAAAGENVRITVVVNNTLSFQSIPPGVIEDTTDGPRQRYFHDFFNYAGLHRSVWLAATGAATRIDDITVVTGLTAGVGTVDYRVALTTADESTRVTAVLRDADGVQVATGTGAEGTLTVENVHKWAPGEGYLYDLEVRLTDPSGDPGRRLPAQGRHPHRRRRRHPLPDQRRTVLLHRFRQARRHRGDRQGPQQRLHGA